MGTFTEKLEQLDKEVADRQAEANRVRQLAEMFPDLETHTDRWKRQRYISKSVNGRVADYELRRTCGCCPDAPRVLWPYVETEFGRVYSNPPSFYLTHFGDFGFNEALDPQFEKSARDAGLPENLIGTMTRLYMREIHEDRAEG